VGGVAEIVVRVDASQDRICQEYGEALTWWRIPFCYAELLLNKEVKYRIYFTIVISHAAVEVDKQTGTDIFLIARCLTRCYVGSIGTVVRMTAQTTFCSEVLFFCLYHLFVPESRIKCAVVTRTSFQTKGRAFISIMLFPCLYFVYLSPTDGIVADWCLYLLFKVVVYRIEVVLFHYYDNASSSSTLYIYR
jgi:hypothetical protein